MAYIGANPQTSLQQYLTIDDISGDFDGIETSFALLVGGVAPVPGPSQSNQLLISLGGVIQEPDDTGSAGFRLSGGNIIFSSAPAGSTAFFGVVLAGADYIYAGTNFPDGSVTTPSITFANDLDSGFYRTGSGELAYTSNGTFRLKIDSSGRLGVGTSSPTDPLTVFGNTSGTMCTIQGSNTTSGYGLFVRAGGSDAGRYVATFQDAASNTRLHILSNGNVGVGTTSPSYKTQIAGTSGTVGLALTGTYASGDIGYYFAPSAVTGTVNAFQSAASATTGVNALFANANTANGTAHARVETQVGGASAGDPKFVMTVSGVTNWSVGIDNSDSDKFKISSSDGPGTNDRLAIDSSGRVGIGTTSPSELLHLYGVTSSSGMRFSDGSANRFSLRLDSSNNAKIETFQSADSIVFSTGGSGAERARVNHLGCVLIGSTASSGSGTRLEVNSNTSGVANVAIIKRNSGTANQHGQNLDFYNFGPSATARADGTEIGAVRFYASQPTSGAAQLGAGIYCIADGTQSGNSVPSKLSFYTSSGTSVPERIRIKADGAVSLGDWHTSAGYHRINRKVAQGGEILIISAYDTATTDTARFFSINTGAYNTNNAALHIGRDSATSRSINAGGTVNASGADYAEYMTKAGDFSLAKGDVCGVNAEGKLTNVFAEAISFVVKSTDPSYVGGDTWGTEEAIGKKPDAKDADALAEWEANLETARQTVDRIAFAGQVPVNVTGATAGQYIIPLQAADGSIEGRAKNEADLTLSEYMQAVGKVIAIEDDGRARIIVKVA